MTALVKSRWRFGPKTKYVQTLLSALGIEYRKGRDFWSANKDHLPYLYSELQTEARLKLRELHPDTGGNEDEFKAFIESISSAKKQFARHGLTIPGIPTYERAKAKRQRLFPHPSQQPEIENLIRSGLADAEITRAIGRINIDPVAVSNLRASMKEKVNCACGRIGNHNGSCKARRERKLTLALSSRQRESAIP